MRSCWNKPKPAHRAITADRFTSNTVTERCQPTLASTSAWLCESAKAWRISRPECLPARPAAVSSAKPSRCSITWPRSCSCRSFNCPDSARVRTYSPQVARPKAVARIPSSISAMVPLNSSQARPTIIRVTSAASAVGAIRRRYRVSRASTSAVRRDNHWAPVLSPRWRLPACASRLNSATRISVSRLSTVLWL